MKNIAKLGLIVLLTVICLTEMIYAAPGCSVSLETSVSDIYEDDEFTVYVRIIDIQSEKGIIALQAVLEYDKEKLELIDMQGQNGWSAPMCNESTGKFITDKNKLVKDDETFMSVTFRVKCEGGQGTAISLKNIKASGGDISEEPAAAYKNITVLQKPAVPEVPSIEDPGEKPAPPAEDPGDNTRPTSAAGTNKPTAAPADNTKPAAGQQNVPSTAAAGETSQGESETKGQSVPSQSSSAVQPASASERSTEAGSAADKDASDAGKIIMLAALAVISLIAVIIIFLKMRIRKL